MAPLNSSHLRIINLYFSYRGFGFITFTSGEAVDKVLAHGAHELNQKIVSYLHTDIYCTAHYHCTHTAIVELRAALSSLSICSNFHLHLWVKWSKRDLDETVTRDLSVLIATRVKLRQVKTSYFLDHRKWPLHSQVLALAITNLQSVKLRFPLVYCGLSCTPDR